VADPYRNAKRDTSHALEHFFGMTHQDPDPSVPFEETRTEMAVSKILKWDDSEGVWLEWEPRELANASDSDLRAAFGQYRGSTWAHRALEWLTAGIPAVVLVEGYPTRATRGGRARKAVRIIGDGYGRLSMAVGLGIKHLPVVVLRERPAS
jgi:hypothetical protein